MHSNRDGGLFSAISIGIAASFLLCGYEFIRSTANTVFKNAYGKEGLPYIMAIMPLGVLAMLYGYGWLLSRLGPRKTLLATSLLSSAAIGTCYVFIRYRPVCAALYIVREAYVVLLIEQYWSFLNSRLGTAAAKKLNGPVCGVASIGAAFGAEMVSRFSVELGPAPMLVFGALAILPAALCSDLAYAHSASRTILGSSARREDNNADGEVVQRKAGFIGNLGLQLFKTHRILILLLGVVLCTQILSTMLELTFQGKLQDAIPDPSSQNAWSGHFFSTLNLAAALSQFIATPLLLRFVSFRIVHIAMPLCNIAACAYLASRPSLQSAAAAYMCFKLLDYSLFRASKEILYIPLPYDARYRAKEVIDVWGYRFGKGASSSIISFLKAGGAVLTELSYSVAGIGAALVWLLLIVPISRHYKRNESET